MKKILFLFVLSLFLVGYTPIPEETDKQSQTEITSDSTDLSLTSDYCKGFEQGFKSGSCYNKGTGCIPKIPPPCPIPRINESTYRHGYDRGFQMGLDASRND